MNFIKDIFKKKTYEDSAYLLKVSNEDYVTKILSEQQLLSEYIDWESQQTLNEFTKFEKPEIKYVPNDFLMKISGGTLNDLKEKRMIEFYKVDSYGWYDSKVHRNQIKLFNVAHPNKLNNLREQNPSIQANSFNQFRKSFRPKMASNILKGAMGLAYHQFKNDYDEFFRKIECQDDQWIIKITDLDAYDSQILIQLLLFQNNRSEELINSITKGSTTLAIYFRILDYALDYFIYNEYSMKDFLKTMAANMKEPETEPLIAELKQLSDRYVDKGLSYNPQISHTKYIKEFIDLAKTDTGQLKHLLDGKELSRSAIFLLGMLNLGDRLDEQFAFGNFVPSIISLTMEHISGIRTSKDLIIISFDISEIEKNRNNKFTYVKEYFNELQLVKDLKDQLEELKVEAETINSEIGTLKEEKDNDKNNDTSSNEDIQKELGNESNKSEDTAVSKPKNKTGKTRNIFKN